MSYTPASPQAAPARQRGALPYVAAGCALIAVCVLCAAVAGGGYYFYNYQHTVSSPGVPSVEYILDATARMSQQAAGENDTRLNVARGVLAEIVRPSDPTVTAGLRVFGSGAQPAACSDTTLLVPLAPASQTQISGHLLAVTTGVNPAAAMSQAMIAAIRDLAPLKGKHTLVVVTGGADSCNPQAGELINAEAKKAGIDLQLFVVGFQVTTDDGTAIKGLVDSSGGNYIEADNKEKLNEVLKGIQQYAQDQKAGNVSSVLSTAAAAVGTQNIVSQGTPTPPLGTIMPGNVTTPVPSLTPGSGNNPAPTTAAATTAATSAATAATTGGGVGQTACDHPYFPLRPGATWTFTSDNGPTTWTVTGVTGDKNEATATMSYSTGGAAGVFNWHCTADGIVSYEFGSVGTGSGMGVDFKITQHSGVWLPAADLLKPGYAWDNSYTMEGSSNGGGSAVTFTDSIDQHLSVAGADKQSVGSKSYDALRIEGSSNMSISAGAASNVSITGTNTYWLVNGIGPVRFDASYQSSTSSSVLTSYSIP